MLVKEIKSLLNKFGIRHRSNESKSELVKKLESVTAQRITKTANEPKQVSYQGRKVIRLLDGVHTKTHFHCEMEGGITQHVPKKLFQ